MPIDPAGTTPGLAPGAKPQETVNMKCRRDPCPSITAVVVKIPGHENVRMYRCVTCSHQWGLNVGGNINL